MRVGGRHLGAVIVAWIAFAPSVEANPSSLPTEGQFVSGFFLSVLVGLIIASRSPRRRWPDLPRLTIPRFLLVYLGVVCVLYAMNRLRSGGQRTDGTHAATSCRAVSFPRT